MADYTNVDKSYLMELSDKQETAASDIGRSAGTDPSAGIDRTHGSYMFIGSRAIEAAARARSAAGEALAKMFKDTADKLRKAEKWYSNTDDDQARDLDKHMQDG